jgi:hypothetical protein
MHKGWKTGYLALLPIDVLQVQSDNLAGPEPQPGKQQQDRVVPSTDGRLSITTIEYPLHRVCGKETWGGPRTSILGR